MVNVNVPLPEHTSAPLGILLPAEFLHRPCIGPAEVLQRSCRGLLAINILFSAELRTILEEGKI